MTMLNQKYLEFEIVQFVFPVTQFIMTPYNPKIMLDKKQLEFEIVHFLPIDLVDCDIMLP